MTTHQNICVAKIVCNVPTKFGLLVNGNQGNIWQLKTEKNINKFSSSRKCVYDWKNFKLMHIFFINSEIRVVSSFCKY